MQTHRVLDRLRVGRPASPSLSPLVINAWLNRRRQNQLPMEPLGVPPPLAEGRVNLDLELVHQRQRLLILLREDHTRPNRFQRQSLPRNEDKASSLLRLLVTVRKGRTSVTMRPVLQVVPGDCRPRPPLHPPPHLAVDRQPLLLWLSRSRKDCVLQLCARRRHPGNPNHRIGLNRNQSDR